jgi:cell division protein ZapB
VERQVFEILEEKIDQAMKKMETLTQENMALREKIKEKEEVIQGAQARLDVLEEEKELIKSKVDEILKKISRVLG